MSTPKTKTKTKPMSTPKTKNKRRPKAKPRGYTEADRQQDSDLAFAITLINTTVANRWRKSVLRQGEMPGRDATRTLLRREFARQYAGLSERLSREDLACLLTHLHTQMAMNGVNQALGALGM